MSEEEKIGKNLFEYNGIIYTDNIPENMFISITKEQYAEYMQQKETIEKQQKEIEELKEIKWYYEISRVAKDEIREKIKELDKKTFECKCSYVEYYYKNEVLNELLEE